MDLREFVRKNIKQISLYRTIISEEDWAFDDYTEELNTNSKDSNKKVINTLKDKLSSFEYHDGLVKSILNRLKYFLKTYDNERRKKDFEKYLKTSLEAINIHLERSEDFVNETSEKIIKNKVVVREYLKITDEIFSSTSKTREDMSGYNLTLDNETTTVDTKKDQYVPLVMHDVVVNKYPFIKVRLDEMGIDFKRKPDNKMHIHNEKKYVWEIHKHYYEQDAETLQYYVDEIKKIRNGITIDGVYISGWLYYQYNYFTAKYPTLKENESTKQIESVDIIGVPPLRDNEWWFINDNYEVARRESKNIFIGATRRGGKTTLNASHLGFCVASGKRNLVVASGSKKDLGQLKDAFIILQNNIDPALRVTLIKEDWDDEVELGFQYKTQKKEIASVLKIINLDGGADKKSEILAGFTPDAVLIDEIMKVAVKSQLDSLLPATDSPYGKRCVVIMSGCVCKGTKVFKSSGEIVNIEDITKEDGIIGINENGISKEPITWLKPPQKKHCYRVTTTGGFSLECSDDHPILMSKRSNAKKGIFEQAKNLKNGDFIYLPEVVAPFGNKEEKNARLLGLLIGDGYNGNRGSELYLEGEKIYEWLKSKYESTITNQFQTKKGTTYRDLYIRGSAKITKEAGIIGLTKENKILPKDWSLYNKNSLSELIAGLIDSDGTVTKKEGNIRVRYTTISKKVVEELRYALMKFGIHSTISSSKRVDTKIKGIDYKRKEIFELSISKAKDIEKFYKNIKLLSESKQITEEDLQKINYKSTTCSLRNIETSYGDKGKYFDGKGEVSNLRRVGVKSVEYIGYQDVYNLTAGTTHTYVANGIVTHNTAGNEQLSKESFDLLSNPSSRDILEMDWDLFNTRVPEEFRTWKKRKFGTFIPAQMSAKQGMIKLDTNLSEFLNIGGKELSKVKIKETNWETAIEIIRQDRLKKEGDIEGHIKEVLYYPICSEDMLTSGKVNNFPTTEAKLHLEYLKSIGGTGKKVYLQENSRREIYYELSNEGLAEYPHKGGFIDCPVVLYEDLPESPPPDHLYVAGFDDYKQEQSSTDSIGSFHVYKVDYSAQDKFSGRIVASLATRPDPHSKLHYQIYLLQRAFNAVCFMENADNDYETYLKTLRVDHLWLKTAIDFNGDMTIESRGKRTYGWNPSNPLNRKTMMSLLTKKLKAHSDVENEDGTITRLLGVQKIDDMGLLEEIIQYTEGNNVDRITSFMSCLGFEFYLYVNNMFPDITTALQKRKNKITENIRQEKRRKGSPFFNTRKKKIF